MPEQIKLEVVTPDKLVIDKNVDIVVATGVEGEFGVLAGHIPFLTTLQIGELRYRLDNALHYAAVAGGFAEVTGTKVTILAEAAEHGEAIDINRANAARERAEKRLAMTPEERRKESIDVPRAEAALKRALTRIKVAEKQRAA